MSYRIKEKVVNVVHVQDCKRNKGCGPACIREKDGWVVDYELMFPNMRYPVRRRQQIPTGWADTERKRDQWAREREAFLISKGRDAEAAQTGITVSKLAQKFLAQRRGEGLDTEKDQQRLEDHILPVVGGVRVSEFRPKHAYQVVSKVKQTPSVRGGNLASATVRAIYFLLRQLFQFALLEELVVGNPVVLQRGVLPRKVDKDPSWRKGAVFTKDEVEALLSSDKIPFHRRVIYAIAFLTGLRPGQVFELRWGDYEPTVEPLGRISSSRSWSSWKKKVKSTKTGVDHLVPVHPVLARMLAEWKLRGWSERHGRTPLPADLIVPTINGTQRDVRKALEDFYEDLEKLGLRRRRQYDTRRTFASLAISAGASKDLVKMITHPRPAEVFDVYVTPTWKSLCDTVSAIPVVVKGGEVVSLRPVATENGATMALEKHRH